MYGVVIYFIVHIIEKTGMGVLADIQKNSLSIMHLHLLIRDRIMIPLFGIKCPISIWIIVSCVIETVITYIASKVAILRLLLLGY